MGLFRMQNQILNNFDFITIRNGSTQEEREYRVIDLTGSEFLNWIGAATPYVPRYKDEYGNIVQQLVAANQPYYDIATKSLVYSNNQWLRESTANSFTDNPRLKVKFYINDTSGWVFSKRTGKGSSGTSTIPEWQIGVFGSQFFVSIFNNNDNNQIFSVTPTFQNNSIYEIDAYYDRANTSWVCNYRINDGAWQQVSRNDIPDIQMQDLNDVLIGSSWGSVIDLNGRIYYAIIEDYITGEVLFRHNMEQ